jgi:formylglycine-generating enzyme
VSENMIELRGGAFLMGSDRFYSEEPVREVSVAPFAIDRHPVTIAEFRRFVRATALREAAASGRVAAETGV